MGISRNGFIASLSILAFVFVTVPSPIHAKAKNPAQLQSFESSAVWKKLDLNFRQAWLDAVEKKELDKSLEAIIKTSSQLTGDQLAVLKSAGYNYRSVIGVIITGGVKVKDVPQVAGLSLIEIMELSMPLMPKR